MPKPLRSSACQSRRKSKIQLELLRWDSRYLPRAKGMMLMVVVPEAPPAPIKKLFALSAINLAVPPNVPLLT